MGLSFGEKIAGSGVGGGGIVHFFQELAWQRIIIR
jgi:hypothetical protein